MKDTKVEDDSFYLLTLAAVAKELKKRGLSDAKVFLAVGLPLTRFGAERNLYILPSSVHEVLAVSTELTEPEELAQMVAEVNMQKVALEERLSNQVYHYDKDLRKLTLATDTPNKRLDGIVAEPQLVYDAKEKAR